MIINPLTGKIEQEVGGANTEQDLTNPRSPTEQSLVDDTTQQDIDPSVMIIDPMSGEVSSGNEPVTEMNPLAKGIPEKDTPEYNYLYGALDVAQGTVELARDVTWGALSWPVAQIVRHGAVAGQKIQQSLGLVPSMTPEQQAAMGENVANYIQTMGGLATPKSQSGQQSLEAVGKVIEPIQKVAHWTAQGINPEKHPNLHNAVATGVEFGLFATIPKVKSGLSKIKKMREESLKLKGKEKAAADLKILEEQDALMKKMEADLESTQMNEMKALINERLEKNQQLMDGAEGFSAIDIAKPEAPKIIDPITGKEVVSLKGSKSELSQSGKGFEGDVRKPDLGAEPVSGLTKNIKTPEEIANEVGVKYDGEFDRTALKKDPLYQFTPQEGPMKGRTFAVEELTVDAVKNKMSSLDSKVKLIEKVPGEKSVWQILTDPIKNESGSITIRPEKIFKDETNTPVIGYHGTQAARFKKFNNKMIQKLEHGWAGAGHYFSTKKESAELYSQIGDGTGRVIEAVFDIKNPLTKYSKEYNDLLMSSIGKKSILNKEDGIKATKAFKEAGYDSVIEGKVISHANEINVFDAKNIHIIEKPTIIDTLLNPLRNERGSIRIPIRRKEVEMKVSESQRNQLRKFGMMAEKQGKTFKEFLSETGLTPKEVHAMEKLHKFVKEENPIASALEPVKRSKGDMTPFELKPGERQVNITKGKGNKKILIGESDANAIFESLPGRKGVGSWFKPAEFMFDRYPKLRNLLDQAREVQSTIKNELEISSKHVEELAKEYSNKKLREEVGAYWHSFSILGKDAMKQMKVEVKADPKYKELKTKLEPKFQDLFKRINAQRVKLGKRPIKETGDYLSFFGKESLLTDFKNLIKGEEARGGYSNLVLDDLATIKQRQATNIKDSPAFAHIKRTGLREGVKLELDPLVIYSRYLNDSLRHIHMSPINAFVKELLTAELTDFKTGKTAVFAEQRPNVAAELASWNNKIAGLDNMEVPRVFSKLLNKGMNNLTVAQLFGNLRTSLIQSTALFPTAVKFGYGPTAKGIGEAVIGRRNAPVKESSVLNTAAWDVAVADMGSTFAGTKYQKVTGNIKEKSAWLMKSVDYFAREATFRTVWNSLEPLVKKGELSKKEAIRLADAEVIRTQGSGDAVELSPVQRNVIGKMATQWQTFTINHMNFVAKDVLGIKNPELRPMEAAKRTLRYVAGALVINSLFEQGLGIQSPMPAPVQGIIRGLEAGDQTSAIMLGTLKEISEAFPGGGSVKFGSNPLGPLVKHADDIAKALSGTTTFNEDMITKASMGDEKAMTALAEILGKTMGVPGTAQAAKFARGQRRGESIPRSLIGRIYEESKKKGGLSSGLDKSRKSRLKSNLK